jgi:hypothetical protein
LSVTMPNDLAKNVSPSGMPTLPPIRLYNQKYYTVRFDEEQNLLYLKKVLSC